MHSNAVRTLFAASAAATLLALSPAVHAGPFTATVFATGTGVSGTAPDSITVGGGHVFVEYGNGASSSATLGTGGASTIAEYDLSGDLQDSFSVLGSADGVRYNPMTNQLWVLQNQDGNSALTVIDPSTDAKTKYNYVSPSTSRGFDDVAFVGGKAYLSYSNPAGTGDPIIYSAALSGNTVNLTSTVLSFGDSGTTDTGGNSLVNDPDSLDLPPSGSLLLTSGDDGALTTVSAPGTASQTVSSVALLDTNGSRVSGLDDTVFASAAVQDLLVADTKNNTVYRVAGPFQAGTAYASVGSLNSVDAVNLTTGGLTSITDGLFAAGASPHGLGFIPAAVPEASTTVSLGLLLALGLGGLMMASKKSAKKNV